MAKTSVVLIIGDESDLSDRYSEWLNEDYTVRKAADGEAAFWHFDKSVDVVLLDQNLPDISGEKLLGQLRDINNDCQYAMFTDDDPGFEMLKLDVDMYVQRPIERGELQELTDRLEERSAVEAAIDSYLRVLSKLRTLKNDLDSSELESDPRYQSLMSELMTRRRQIDSLLTELDALEIDGGDDEESADSEPIPIYQSRSKEFYGLWLLATLSYGVGDIFSTVYVIEFAGIQEANPVIETLLTNFGMGGFFLFKLLVFFVLVSVSVQGARTKDRFSYYWPPLLATVLGVGLTIWNVSLIL